MSRIKSFLPILVHCERRYLIENDSKREIPISFHTLNSNMYLINRYDEIVNNSNNRFLCKWLSFVGLLFLNFLFQLLFDPGENLIKSSFHIYFDLIQVIVFHRQQYIYPLDCDSGRFLFKTRPGHIYDHFGYMTVLKSKRQS